MTNLQSFGIGLLIGAALLWTIGTLERNHAMDRVAAAEALKDEALDTAQAIRSRLTVALKRDSVISAEHADSVEVWRARAEVSEAEATRARTSADAVNAALRASLDSAQTIMLDSLTAETDRVEAALRSELALMTARATTAEQDEQRARQLLFASLRRSDALERAFAASEASSRAKDAIIAHQKREGVILKVLTVGLAGKLAYDLVAQ